MPHSCRAAFRIGFQCRVKEAFEYSKTLVNAIADDEEVSYLVDAVDSVFPDVKATAEDVVAHYAGVRPLPYVDASTPAAVTRRHSLHEHPDSPIPLVSVIGGKLTTCRSLAEEAERVLDQPHLIKAMIRKRPKDKVA